MKYRKLPVVVEASQWFKNGDHPQDDVFRPFTDTGAVPTEPREGVVVRHFRRPEPEYAGEMLHTLIGGGCGEAWHNHGWIDTLEGGHIVCPDDWIITGIRGERYPCKPDIFEATYEPAQRTDEVAVPPPAAEAVPPPAADSGHDKLAALIESWKANPLSREEARLLNIAISEIADEIKRYIQGISHEAVHQVRRP